MRLLSDTSPALTGIIENILTHYYINTSSFYHKTAKKSITNDDFNHFVIISTIIIIQNDAEYVMCYK